jgi:hypothetical protein
VQRSVRVHAGELILIDIENTYPSQFDYSITAIEKPKEFNAQSAGKPETVSLQQIHDAKYGGYVVRATPKDARASLGTLTITIAAETREWRQTFAGAFAVSGLTNPAFGVRDSTVTMPATTTTPAQTRTVSRFVDQGDRRSRESHEPAAFVHVLHSDHPWIGGTFGIGLRTSNAPAYYGGLSFFAGDKAAITLGLVAGSQTTPPAGINIGDSVASANVAANLPTRTTFAPFIGFSFSFIGNTRDKLTAPFLDTQTRPADAAKNKEASRSAAEGYSMQLVDSVKRGKVGDSISVSAKIVDSDKKPVKDVPIYWTTDDDSIVELPSVTKLATGDSGIAVITVRLKLRGHTKVNAKAEIGPPVNGVSFRSQRVEIESCEATDKKCLDGGAK